MNTDASVRIDRDFYARTYAAELGGASPEAHFDAVGRAAGFLPNAGHDPTLAVVSGIAGSEARPLPERYEALARAVLRHFPDPAYDGYFWTFLETHKPADPAAKRPYDEDVLKAPEDRGRMTFDHRGTLHGIGQPSTGAFLDAVAGSSPVFHARLPHGFWDALARVFVLRRILLDHFPVSDLTPDALLRLCVRLASHLHPHNIVFIENFVSEVADLARGLPLNVPIAVAFKAFPDGGPGLFGSAHELPPRARYVFDAVSTVVPERTGFDDAMLMKRLVMTGEFPRFMELLRGRPVLLVANELFSDFGERFDLDDTAFLEVPPRESHRSRNEIVARFRAALRTLCRAGTRPVVLTRCGGSFAFLLLTRLREEFPDVSFFDVGQAINLWFLDRDGIVRTGGLPWSPGVEKQIEINRLSDFYRSRRGIADIKAFHIERHGEHDPDRRWARSSRHLQYAQFVFQHGLRDAADIFVRRALDDTADDPALMRFVDRLRASERPGS
ncbi:hypothetical protein [Microbaculum sp. FT89]|uniref:hypothetical protein n=1 Tax=Microbaculum sp. FT89 TaxID=3447298 RepID=UPI003F52FB0D